MTVEKVASIAVYTVLNHGWEGGREGEGGTTVCSNSSDHMGLEHNLDNER